MRETVVEECETYKNGQGHVTAYNTAGLYVRDDKVVFVYETTSGDDADCCHLVGHFPIEKYKSGIQELMDTGSCLIEGADLSGLGSLSRETLRLTRISDETLRRLGIKMWVEFIGVQGVGTYLHCDANDLVLEF